jgi:hypothetical protein
MAHGLERAEFFHDVLQLDVHNGKWVGFFKLDSKMDPSGRKTPRGLTPLKEFFCNEVMKENLNLTFP